MDTKTEQILEDLKKIIMPYFHSYLEVHSKNPENYPLETEYVFNLDDNPKIIEDVFYSAYPNPISNLNSRPIWCSSKLHQSILHPFDVIRTSAPHIEPTIYRFNILRKHFLRSDNYNNNKILNNLFSFFFTDLIDKITDYFICLDKEFNGTIDTIFYQENNKRLIFILMVLNKILTDLQFNGEKIYGYTNRHDQDELAIIPNSDLLQNIIESKIVEIKYLKIIETYPDQMTDSHEFDKTIQTEEETIVTFPMDISKFRTLFEPGLVNYISNFQMYEKYRMTCGTIRTISYQNFDNPSEILIFTCPRREEYWHKKYFKYKGKYLKLLKKLKLMNEL